MPLSSLLRSFRFSLRGFTDRAVKVLNVAWDQSAARHQGFVAPEHVLLALARVEPGPGRAILKQLGIDLAQDAEMVEALAAATADAPGDRLAFSAEAERLLEEATRASEELGHNYVGTEHLVMGLLRCGTCPAGDYLRRRGLSEQMFREEAIRFLTDSGPATL